MRRLLLSLVVLAAACKSQPREMLSHDPVPLPSRVTAANLRPVGDTRRGYGSERAEATLVRLKGLGVNTVVYLLEGRMDHLEDTEIRGPEEDELDRLREGLVTARRLGFATIVIPHLYLDDGEWRGRIHPSSESASEAWWSSYRDFMLSSARLSRSGSATVLSVGVELKALSSEPEAYRRMKALVTEVREIFPGHLTYSANWDEAETVGFWDLVDFAGVNGYYPLEPDPVRGAEAVARRLSALSKRAEREVLVLEVGYRAGPASHQKPWEWPEEVVEDVDENAQASAWAAVLASWLSAPGVRGLGVWVIPTDPDDPASEPRNGFNPLNRPAEKVIARAFRDRP
jgi:hypothetical protein